MRHALLARHRRLGEGHPEIAREEQRIVAEAAAPARFGQNPPLARRLDQLRLGERRVEIRHDAPVARRALLVGNTRPPLEQQRVVRRVTPPPPPPPPGPPPPSRGEHPPPPRAGVPLAPRDLPERRGCGAPRQVP